MNTQNDIIAHTLHWIESFIIPLNICPFAKKEIRKKSIRFYHAKAQESSALFQELSSELAHLMNHPEIETSLFIFTTLGEDFFSYLDLLDTANQLLIDQGFEGVFQLASFHPDYFFADTDFNDPANLTNRSPYPMFHILREESLAQAIQRYGDTTSIPEKNINLLRQLGRNGSLKTAKKSEE